MVSKISWLRAAAFLALAAGAATAPAGFAQSPTTQTAKHFKLAKKKPLEADYLLFLPASYGAKADQRWPLMLFLHGSGERGSNVWQVARHGPPKEVAAHPEFPFIVVSPQCPKGQTWSEEVVMALLEDVTQHYRVDTRRLYLTGLSMGGFAAWKLGLKYPEKFAAIVPICGGGDAAALLPAGGEKAAALRTLGIWAFHGAKDPTVPVSQSKNLVDALQKFGVEDLQLTIYPEARHDCWTQTYKNPELFVWLLKHERLAAKE